MTGDRPDRNFWHGRRVLLTGHTGFKGGWLTIWLHRLGAQVTGIGRPPNTTPNLFDLAGVNNLCTSHICDIRDYEAVAGLIKEALPDIVFHLAAQPLVRESYRLPLDTLSTNILGTANVLNALRGLQSVQAAVIVTTDKVYRNKEWLWAYREDDVLGGHDPYSASKAASEIVIACYRDAFLAEQGIGLASARAGNVIGGGDWSADRLVPDAIRAWQSDRPLIIRNPNAMRPWQHVLEPLAGYLALASKLASGTPSNNADREKFCSSFNFGPATDAAASVKEVIDLAQMAYGSGVVQLEGQAVGPHEAGMLSLDAAKARVLLGVKPQWSLGETVRRTMAWYRSQHQGVDARALCEAEIADYEAVH